jgi:hypothetical protein
LMSARENPAESTDHAAVVAANALRLHAHYRGKIATIPKVPLSGANELAISRVVGFADRIIHIEDGLLTREGLAGVAL